MLKVHFRHEKLEGEKKAAMVIVYDDAEQADGTHISANAVFRPKMFYKIVDKDIEEFFDKMIPALEQCIEAVLNERENQNDNSAA